MADGYISPFGDSGSAATGAPPPPSVPADDAYVSPFDDAPRPSRRPIGSIEEYENLPGGATYLAPDGSERAKPIDESRRGTSVDLRRPEEDPRAVAPPDTSLSVDTADLGSRLPVTPGGYSVDTSQSVTDPYSYSRPEPVELAGPQGIGDSLFQAAAPNVLDKMRAKYGQSAAPAPARTLGDKMQAYASNAPIVGTIPDNLSPPIAGVTDVVAPFWASDPVVTEAPKPQATRERVAKEGTNTPGRLGSAVGYGTVRGISDMLSFLLPPLGPSSGIERTIQGALDPGRAILEKISPDLVNRDFTPESGAERVAWRVGQEIGGNAIPAGGALTAARVLGPTAARGVFAPLINPARVGPGVATATDMGLATTAGLGAGGARELVGGDETGPVAHIADFLGALAGGLAPMGVAGAWNAVPRALPVTRDAIKEAAAGRLNAKPTQAVEIDAAKEAAPAIPGMRYTTADLLNEPQMLAEARRLERQVDPAGAVERRQANSAAIKDYAAAETPAGNTAAPRAELERRIQGAEAFRADRTVAAENAAADRLGQAETTAQAKLAAAQREADDIIAAERAKVSQTFEAGSSGMKAEDASRLARSELVDAEAAAAQQAGRLYRDVDPEGVLRLPTDPLVTAIKEVRRRQSDEFALSADMPAFMREGLDAKVGPVVTYDQVKAIRKTLTDEIREAERQGKRGLAGNAKTLLGGVEGMLKGLDEAGAAGVAAAGNRVAADAAASRQAGMPVERETAATVYTPRNRPVDVQYEVVEANSLIPSHRHADLSPREDYPADLQPRDRTRAASERQVNDIANNLNPALLGRSALISDGAPMIGSDMVVESGNGRVMALQRAYDRNLPGAEKYRAWLGEQGFSTEGMNNPVLVRRRTSELSPEERAVVAREANERSTASMSATEQAASDARVMPDSMLDLYRGGDIGSAANSDFVRRFVKDVAAGGDAGGMMTKDRELSKMGRERIEAAVLAKAYGDEGLLGALLESGDEGIKAVALGLRSAAPEWARLRAATRSGDVPPEMDITPSLMDAARIVRDARSRDMSVKSLLDQQDAFAPPVDPIADRLLRAFFGEDLTRRARNGEVSDILEGYAQEAQKNLSSARLFSDMPDVQPGEILQRVGERASAGREAEGNSAGRGGGAGGGAGKDGAIERPARPDAAGAKDRATIEPEVNLDPDVVSRYRLANEFFKENVAKTFRAGAAKQVLAKDGSGGPRVAPSAALSRFVKPGAGGEEAIQDFVRAVGSRPAAVQALKDYAIDMASRYATGHDGRVSSAKLAKVRERYKPVMDAFPEVERTLSNVARLQTYVDDLGRTLPERVGAVEAQGKDAVRQAKTEGREAVKDAKGRQRRTAESVQKSAAQFWLDRDPEKAVGVMLGGKDPVAAARDSMRLVRKDPDAVKGVSRATWEYLTKKMTSAVEDEGVRLNASANLLRDKGPALEVLLGGKAQFEKAKNLLEAATITTRTNRASVRGGSDSVQNLQGLPEKAIRSIPAILGAAAGAPFGGVIGSALGATAAHGAAALVRRQQAVVEKLMLEALTDPEVYKTLIMQVNKANERIVANRLRQHIASLGIRVADDD